LQIAAAGDFQADSGFSAGQPAGEKKIIGPSPPANLSGISALPHPRPSAIENSDDLPQTLPLLLEFPDSLNSGKDLLIVQTVSGLCTFGFCNQTENRIVMNGLTSEARIPHHLANLVELPGNHGITGALMELLLAADRSVRLPAKTLADGRWQNKPFNWSTRQRE